MVLRWQGLWTLQHKGLLLGHFREGLVILQGNGVQLYHLTRLVLLLQDLIRCLEIGQAPQMRLAGMGLWWFEDGPFPWNQAEVVLTKKLGLELLDSDALRTGIGFPSFSKRRFQPRNKFREFRRSGKEAVCESGKLLILLHEHAR